MAAFTSFVRRHNILRVQCCNVMRARSLRISVANRAVFDVSEESDFETKVLKSKKPVLVDFHANWCGPCKILGPKLESALRERQDRIDLAKVDIDVLPDIALNHQVTAVPAIMGFKDGEQLGQFVGVQGDEVIEALLDVLDDS